MDNNDNDPGKAAQVKQIYPYDPVFLYNLDTKIYTQYFIEYTHKRKIFKNGEIVSMDEVKQI